MQPSLAVDGVDAPTEFAHDGLVDQARAEPLARRRRNPVAGCLQPFEGEDAIRNSPADVDGSAAVLKGSVLGRVGPHFMNRHPESNSLLARRLTGGPFSDTCEETWNGLSSVVSNSRNSTHDHPDSVRRL
jgi:hypothetical protein